MSPFKDQTAFDAAKFSGRARLFPLPNLVLFPHVIQPLHIFEPRYVELLHEALSGDRLIAMAVLKPGWESDYEGRPPIAEVCCLSRVLTWQAAPERRYNLLTVGLRRVRIVRELPPDKSFREAEVELLRDAYPKASSSARRTLQRQLGKAFERLLPSIPDAAELFSQLSLDEISLGALSDLISYSLDLNVMEKQALLAECNVDRRAKRLLTHLEQAAEEQRPEQLPAGFPPSFSAN